MQSTEEARSRACAVRRFFSESQTFKLKALLCVTGNSARRMACNTGHNHRKQRDKMQRMYVMH